MNKKARAEARANAASKSCGVICCGDGYPPPPAVDQDEW
jgi:hypothetical protein